MKKDFINFVHSLMEIDPVKTDLLMNENVKAYLEMLEEAKDEKPVLTDNGRLILSYMQKDSGPTWKSRDIAEGLFVSSRTVSGSLRKLVNDGFCEKVGQDPVVYALTDQGKNYNINEEN